jgi:WD40 repeat protein
MNILRKVHLLFFCILVISLIPMIQAIEPTWTYTTNDAEIGNIAVSSDGSTIVVAAHQLWFFSKDGTLLKKEPYAEKVVLTPSGRYAVSFFGDTIYFFRAPLTTGSPDPKQLNKIWESSLPNLVRSVEVTDDGRTIVAATEGNGIFIITTETQKSVSNSTSYDTIFKISHDGSRIVGISADKIRVYSSNAKTSKNYNIASNLEPEFMFLSQTIPLIVYNDGKTIHWVDVSLGTELWRITAPGSLTSLSMTPSGSFVVVGTENGNIERYTDKGTLNWSYLSNKEILTPRITAIAISKDGALVAAGSSDGNILILNANGNLLGSYQAKDPIRSITISNDGSIVLAADEKNIYAFITGPSTSSISYYRFDPKNLTQGSLNNSNQKITISGNLTTQPSITPLTKTSVDRTTPILPTTYSVIRTATQSRVSALIPLLGILGALVLLSKRRNF